MKRRTIFIGLGLLGAALILAACQQAAPTPIVQEIEVTRQVEVTRVVEPTPSGPVIEVPYEVLWAGSAHNAVDTEPFRHWDGDDPPEVPTSCARCHTTAGYQDYLGADGSEAGKVDAAVPAA